MTSLPPLPGCTLHLLANPVGSHPKLWMASVSSSACPTAQPLLFCTPPCLHLMSPQAMLQAVSRLESGTSPLCPLPRPPLQRPKMLTAVPRSLCLCSFTIIPDALATTEPVRVLSHLSTSEPLHVYIHGLWSHSDLSGVSLPLAQNGALHTPLCLTFLSITYHLTCCTFT